MWWNPKALSPHVTNLELWAMIGLGFLVGRRLDLGIPGWLALVVATPFFIRWWRGFCGLDQWPMPHGRYYSRWMSLKGVGDYYDWLAREMRHRQPWKDWALEERLIGDGASIDGGPK